MRQFAEPNNLGFCISKQQKASTGFFHVLAQTIISESSLTSNKTAEIGSSFPLYLYPDENAEEPDAFALADRTVNMDAKIRKKIEEAAMGLPSPLVGEGGSARSGETGEGLGDDTPHPSATLTPSPTRGEGKKKPDEVAIFDYIYGVLHCPAYRETFREFLKIDFPRIPYPASPQSFWDISSKGTKLRQLHLMDKTAIGETPFPFEGTGDSVVDKPDFVCADGGETGAVFINKTQSFADVPKIAWEFYIGGYQPAQKWLKDRKGRTLSFEDVRHYQRIIKILFQTDAIMKTIKVPLGRTD